MQTPGRQFQREALRSRNMKAMLVQPGFPDQPCTVSDISDGGAKIVVDGTAPIRTRFVLALGNDRRRVCEPIWWHGTTIGLRFVR